MYDLTYMWNLNNKNNNKQLTNTDKLMVARVGVELPMWLRGTESAFQCKEIQEMWVRSQGWEDPLERKWLPIPVFLPGESHRQGYLAGYSPQGHRVGHD